MTNNVIIYANNLAKLEEIIDFLKVKFIQEAYNIKKQIIYFSKISLFPTLLIKLPIVSCPHNLSFSLNLHLGFMSKLSFQHLW